MNEQTALDFPRSIGEDLAERCADKARRVSDFDSEGAGRFIAGWLIRHGALSGEALTDAAKQHGFRPHSDKAFGAVIQRLVKRGQIRCIGFGMRQKGHGTAGLRIWAAVQ